MKPTMIYCYDAYCGWCYGFSPVIKKIAEEYKDKFEFEVLSGGMVISEKAKPIAATAGYIQQAYKVVEEHTGVKFGSDYLWHINNPDLSDWYPDSEKPAIALCIFKEFYPEKQIEFAGDLQYALHYEGRDLCDDEAYSHLLEKYSIVPEAFYTRLKSEAYTEKAYYEFAMCRQLNADSFPQVLIQLNENKFYLLTKGYTDYGTLDKRIQNILSEIQPVIKT